MLRSDLVHRIGVHRDLAADRASGPSSPGSPALAAGRTGRPGPSRSPDSRPRDSWQILGTGELEQIGRELLDPVQLLDHIVEVLDRRSLLSLVATNWIVVRIPVSGLRISWAITAERLPIDAKRSMRRWNSSSPTDSVTSSNARIPPRFPPHRARSEAIAPPP